MRDKSYNVLFICTGNSARSILAEALMNRFGQGRFVAQSAGSHPRGSVHPLAIETLGRLGLPMTGYRSKSWDEFAGPRAHPLDFVFTVCDKAGGEECPAWAGQPMTAHWGVPDPGEVQGSDEQKARAFLDTALMLKRRIELLLALPLKSLDAIAIRREIQHIGQQ